MISSQPEANLCLALTYFMNFKAGIKEDAVGVVHLIIKMQNGVKKMIHQKGIKKEMKVKNKNQILDYLEN